MSKNTNPVQPGWGTGGLGQAGPGPVPGRASLLFMSTRPPTGAGIRLGPDRWRASQEHILGQFSAINQAQHGFPSMKNQKIASIFQSGPSPGQRRVTQAGT